MTVAGKEITTGWMTWREIAPYKEQLIDLELELMIDHHYPDWNIPRSYPAARVEALERFLEEGNTFFWGAVCDGQLVGYYWAYTTPFIDRKRWCLRSLMIRKEYRSCGLGKLAIHEGLRKAVHAGCDEAAVEYASFNEAAARAYEKAGYQQTRIEAVRSLADMR